MTHSQIASVPPPPALPIQGTPAPFVVPLHVLSPRDVDALRARASELSNQVRSATSRRNDTRNQLKNATGADKAGLEQRLGVLDARIARLETDIDENGKQLASLDAQRATTTAPSPIPRVIDAGRAARVAVPLFAVFIVFVLSPIAVSISRNIWRRSNNPRVAPSNPENAQRLERMEQAIDSIAIEVERVSEGQRFVTRLLAEGAQIGGKGGAQAANPQPDRIGVPR